MSDYNHISDQERRKLFQDFSEAAKKLGGSEPEAGGLPTDQPLQPSKAERDSQKDASELSPMFASRRRYKRPAWRMRLKIDTYAYTQGFDICGFRQFFNSLFSFFSPGKDIINRKFAKPLVQDHPYRADPSGYCLSRTLLEIRQTADTIIRSTSFLRRSTDHQDNLADDLKRDLLTWEPFGYRFLELFQHRERRVLDSLEFLRRQFDGMRPIDVFDLVLAVKTVYRATLQTDVPFDEIRDRVINIGELVKSNYKRIYSGEQTVQQVSTRIDQAVDEFIALYARLKWFSRQLYPPLLKILNRFEEETKAHLLAQEIYSFIGLDRKRTLKSEPKPQKIPEKPPVVLPAENVEEKDRREEYEGILRIMEYTFPGSQIDCLLDGDYSALVWFQQRLFSAGEIRSPIAGGRPEFVELLKKLSKEDPMGPVILLHEIIGQLIEVLEPEGVAGLTDPLKSEGSVVKDQFLALRSEWGLIRGELLERYLKEIDYYEKETTLGVVESFGVDRCG